MVRVTVMLIMIWQRLVYCYRMTYHLKKGLIRNNRRFCLLQFFSQQFCDTVEVQKSYVYTL